jgi:hypothetical protein
MAGFRGRVRKNTRLPQDMADALHTLMRLHGMLSR